MFPQHNLYSFNDVQCTSNATYFVRLISITSVMWNNMAKLFNILLGSIYNSIPNLSHCHKKFRHVIYFNLVGFFVAFKAWMVWCAHIFSFILCKITIHCKCNCKNLSLATDSQLNVGLNFGFAILTHQYSVKGQYNVFQSHVVLFIVQLTYVLMLYIKYGLKEIDLVI